MQNLILKIRQLMEGRNGIDKISIAMLVLYSLLSFVKIFLRFVPLAYYIVTALQYAFICYAVFRVMSKNLQKRYNENFRFEQLLLRWKPYTDRLKLRIQFAGTHRFRKCRSCGEFLRFRKGRGKRNTVCPRCGKELTFRFLF